MVNLPCLKGSCPNFLHPTCPYTECLISFQTGQALRNGLLPATALVCISILLTCSFHRVRFSVDASPASFSAGHCANAVVHATPSLSGLLSRTLPSLGIIRNPARLWNIHFYLPMMQVLPAFPAV